MTLTQSKMLVVGAIAIAGITLSLMIQRQSRFKLSDRIEAARQLDDQLAELEAQHQRLSYQPAQTGNLSADHQMSELQKLRGEVAALREQTNDLSRNREKSLPRAALRTDEEHHPQEYWDELHQRATGKIRDAEVLIYGISGYAEEHHGEIPSSLEQVAPYSLKQHRSLTGTNEFEIVYQGTVEDLKNIPSGAVAVIRERQPWLEPNGKWARAYAMNWGWVQIVESEDNFQSWEAEHIIPPPSAGQ